MRNKSESPWGEKKKIDWIQHNDWFQSVQQPKRDWLGWLLTLTVTWGKDCVESIREEIKVCLETDLKQNFNFKNLFYKNFLLKTIFFKLYFEKKYFLKKKSINCEEYMENRNGRNLISCRKEESSSQRVDLMSIIMNSLIHIPF